MRYKENAGPIDLFMGTQFIEKFVDDLDWVSLSNVKVDDLVDAIYNWRRKWPCLSRRPSRFFPSIKYSCTQLL
jgi:hypothetical protein